MAMVRQSPASQSSSRPSWPAAPTSSTPPETDDPVSHTTPGNLHGAIGEHRRSSRSSSVSSGGSSTNSGEGMDSARQQTQSRLSSLSSTQDPTLEQPGIHILQATATGGNGPSSEKELGEALSGKEGKQSMPETEQRGPTASPGESQQSPGPFTYFTSNLDEHGFADASKQGHPGTGNRSFPSSGIPNMPGEAEISRLLSQTFSPTEFTGSLRQDLNQMGLNTCFFDRFTPNQAQAPSDAELGADAGVTGGAGVNVSSGGGGSGGNGGFQQPSASTTFTSGNFNSGGYQQFMSQGNNQFSPNMYNQSQPTAPAAASNRGANFYSPQPGFNGNTGFYNQNRPGNDYFMSSTGNFQTFSPRDFTLPPPPAQPWGSGILMNDAMIKKITCECCTKQYKWPHVLECLHVFCFTCMVNKYNQQEKAIYCANCARKTKCREDQGPCALNLDYDTCRFMRNLKISPVTCTLCTREQEAVITCLTCMAFLCSECREGHRSILQFQGHSLIPITKTVKDEYGNEYSPHCEKHYTMPLTKYCVVCDILACAHCRPDHLHPDYPSKEGSFHDLNDVHPIIIERMLAWNEDSTIKYKECREAGMQVPIILQTIDSKKRSARKQIDDYADYCKTVVDQNRMAAYEMLDRTAAAVENQILQWQKTIHMMEKNLEALVNFNCRTVEKTQKNECLLLTPVMENEYKRCMEIYATTVLGKEMMEVDLKFDPNYKESHTILNQNFMAISYFVNNVEHKVPLSTGSNRMDGGRGRSFSDYAMGENSDCNYQRWSAAPDSMSISTWNNGNERDRKNGTFIPHLNRCRIKTSYIHMFGEYGRGEYAFTEPSGQAYLKDGSYVICDTNNHRIVYFNEKHEYVRTIGQPPNLPPLAEEQEQRGGGPRSKGFARQDGYLYFPNRVAICPITQHIVATERPPSHDIQIFTVEGEFIRCFGGNILQHPRGVTVDEKGIIIVVECKVMKVVMFNQDGTFIVSHSLTKDLEFPNDVAAKDEKIFISDNRGHCVQVFDYNAEFLYKIGNESITYFPIGVSINHLNQVVVTDNHNTFNITVFDIAGHVLHIFESVSKLAQCHNVAVHPSSLELMLTTKDCCVYFFNYDPNISHPVTPPTGRGIGHGAGNANTRRPRGNNGNNGGSGSFF